MRRCTDLQPASKKRKPSNGLSDGSALFDQEMELDEQMQDGWEPATTDTEDSASAAKFNELLTEAVQYGQQLRSDYPTDDRGGDKQLLDDIFSLVAYPDPKRSVHGHHLDPTGRVHVAEELNSAILGIPYPDIRFAMSNETVSLGKSSSAALERLYQQTEVLINEISDGGAGAFINVRDDFLL